MADVWGGGNMEAHEQVETMDEEEHTHRLVRPQAMQKLLRSCLFVCLFGGLANRFVLERAPPQGKFQLLPSAPPYYPIPRGIIHTRGNIWSFTVR